MEDRKTLRPEDMSYALFGILGVTLPVIYGEKFEGARQRLLAAIHQRDQAASQKAEYHRKISNWLTNHDPWMDHESARERHEPHTGDWLLRHSQYLAWKSGGSRSLWVYGKVGCGKTILCSTAIEDIRTCCQHSTNAGHAIFYFSFSDSHKQTYQNLIRSLVIQLGWKEPGLTMLRQAYERVEQKQLGIDELQKILISSISSYNKVFLQLDALDECPEGNGVRENVLDGIKQLMERTENVRVLVTSRDVPDVRRLMEELNGEHLSISVQPVNMDIQIYVSTQLSRNFKLSRLDNDTKKLIADTLAQKADGMHVTWRSCKVSNMLTHALV